MRPPGPAAYSPFADFDGDGRILAADYAAVRLGLSSSLPPPPPSALFGDPRRDDQGLAAIVT
jgi:hypothetical protein